MLFRSFLPADQVANTILDAPSIWFHIPDSRMVSLELSIFGEESEEALYHKKINHIEGRHGLLHLAIPDNLLEVDKSYFWDLSMNYDEIDRSASVFIFGELNVQNLEKLSLQTDPDSLETLVNALTDEHSVLSLEKQTADQLVLLLDTQPTTKNIRQVEDRLRQHFIERRDTYAQTQNMILELSGNPELNSAQLMYLNTYQQQLELELAQLSSFFGLWGDATHFLAMNRTDRPEEWQLLVKALLQEREFLPATNEAITIISTAPEF